VSKRGEMHLKPVMAMGVVMVVVSFVWIILPVSQKKKTDICSLDIIQRVKILYTCTLVESISHAESDGL
jgi:hypothetical protein